LRALSACLPVESLYNDRANDKIGHKKEQIDTEKLSEQLEELARQMLGAFADRRDEQKRILAGLTSIEPFALHPRIAESIQAKLEIK
jgi:hypothetical protein